MRLVECILMALLCTINAVSDGAKTVIAFNGTLIMCINSKVGLVIMADRTGTGIATAADTEFCKIRKVGKFAATVATGANRMEVRQLSENSSKCVFSFDSSRTSETELSQCDLSSGIKQYLPKLAEKLAAEFASCTSAAEARELMALNEGSIFQQLFFNFNKVTNKFEGMRILFFLKDGPQPEISWTIDSFPGETFEKSYAIRAGEISVIKSLVGGSKYNLDQANYATICRYLITHEAPERNKTSVEMATAVLSRCFLLASAHSKPTHKIGSTIDEALISEVEGFKWLKQKTRLVNINL